MQNYLDGIESREYTTEEGKTQLHNNRNIVNLLWKRKHRIKEGKNEQNFSY